MNFLQRKPRVAKANRVLSFSLPALGRIAVSRDPGEAEMFSQHFFRTSLTGRLLDQKGRLIEAYDWGSGLVTNIGVLGLAYDSQWEATKMTPAESVSTFRAQKWHAWGTSATAVAKTDFELNAYAAPTKAAGNAVEGTNELVYENKGKNQKLKSKAKIKAESTLEIKEWGLHSAKSLQPAEKTAAASGQTATLLKGEAAAFTASSETVRGELNTVAWAKESEGVSHAVIGLITKSTTTELTVPGWVKAGEEEKGEVPKASTKYRIVPVLWDHKTFTTVGVESGNEIEFIYELEIVAGG